MCLKPAFTSADGDTIYAISVGKKADKVDANLDAVGALAATLLEEALADAVRSSTISEAEYLEKVWFCPTI